MVSSAIKARLNFLAASAHLYSSVAPATSAHLMLECKRVATGNDVTLKETEPKSSCGACGTVLVSGWTSRTFVAGSRRSKKAQLKSRHKAQVMQGVASKLVISKCLVCRRSTKTPLMTATRSGVSGTKSSGSRPLPSATSLSKEANSSATNTAEHETQKVPSANLSSKKRAKARKQSGLQAMLEKSKIPDTQSSGFGLELMDLMTKA
ncbi:hypothetical protein MMC22_004954 [Lobaria immixta]|nr:hypothetical protein [Lobaria immixta]